MDSETVGQGRTVWRALVGAVLLATVYLSACNEIGVPFRTGFYGYSKIVSDVVVVDTTVDGVEYFTGDTITDTLDFAWPPSALPVRIWVQDTVDLQANMRAAVDAWRNVLQYGEVAATFVSDSTTADIIVRGSAPPPTPVAQGVRRLSTSTGAPAACEGATDFHTSAPDHTKLWTPIRTYVTPKFPLNDPLTRPCLARVTMHELGHALGLFRHSPDVNDLMYTFPDTAVNAPSEGDVTTILELYHQVSDLRPALGRDTLPVPAPTP